MLRPLPSVVHWQSMTKNLEADQKADEELKDKFVGNFGETKDGCSLQIFVSFSSQKLMKLSRGRCIVIEYPSTVPIAISKDCWCKENNEDKKAAIAAGQQLPQLEHLSFVNLVKLNVSGRSCRL